MLSPGCVYINLISWLQYRLSAQHQSNNQQAASADCLTDADVVISADLAWNQQKANFTG